MNDIEKYDLLSSEIVEIVEKHFGNASYRITIDDIESSNRDIDKIEVIKERHNSINMDNELIFRRAGFRFISKITTFGNIKAKK